MTVITFETVPMPLKVAPFYTPHMIVVGYYGFMLETVCLSVCPSIFCTSVIHLSNSPYLVSR